MPEVLDEIQQDLTPPADPRLGRLVHFDPRSANYQVRSLLMAEGLNTFRSRRWRLDHWLDQGQEGACVGFGITHELGAEPVFVAVDNAKARALYKRAQQIDPWPGEAYEGTSVLAGMQVSVQDGYYGEFRWAGAGSGKTLEDIALSISNLGPVVYGVPWKSPGMSGVDPAGFIHASGTTVGGHCIVEVGQELVWRDGVSGDTPRQLSSADFYALIDIDRSYDIWRNSWGRFTWGHDGECKISFRDKMILMQEWGECAVPIIRSDPNPQPDPTAKPVYKRFDAPRLLKPSPSASVVNWETGAVSGTYGPGAQFSMVGSAQLHDGRIYLMDAGAFGTADTSGTPGRTVGVLASELEIIVPPAPPGPTPPAPTDLRFFSTKGSAVFHDLHRGIATTGRTYYATREAAIAAGKRPCGTCRP